MVNSNSLRVHLLVLLYDSFNSGLSHAESARIHGVGVSTSRYAAKWCRRRINSARRREKSAHCCYGRLAANYFLLYQI